MAPAQLPYGVPYSPPDGSQSSTGLTLGDIQRSEIKYVRVQWVDLINQIRYRVLPGSYFLRIIESSSRPGVSLAVAALGLVAGAACPGFSGVGEWLYVFDLDTLRLATYEPGHVTVMGYFQQKVPTPSGGLDVALCPRTILKRVVLDAEKNAGVRFLAGVEHEFVLLTETSPATAINLADWSVSNKLPSGSREAKVLREIADVLQKADIELQMYHAEAAAGQYEVITGPLSPLEAADIVIFTRETIYNVASKYGLRATFATRVRPGAFTSAHTHISVHDIKTSSSKLVDAPVKFGQTLTSSERSFLQGVLTNLPSLLAITYPTTTSYDRVTDGMWTGGSYVSWGTDNRETTVRLTGSPGGHHFEVRCVDGTSNPYLVLAAILGAGTSAIKEKAELTFGDCRKAVPGMTREERQQAGMAVPVQLPRDIVQARNAMRESKVMGGVFGEEFITKYRSVNESLETYLSIEEEEARITKLVMTY